MKVLRFVICNIDTKYEKDVIEALYPLIKRGIVKVSDIHAMEEDK